MTAGAGDRFPSAASLASVIMALGPALEHLGEQVAALARQTYAGPWELVLAYNDPAQVERGPLGMTLPPPCRVLHVRAAEQRGPAHARNQGSRASSGEVLLFCDSDDVVADDWVEAMVLALRDADAVGGHLEERSLNGARAAWRPALTPGRLSSFTGLPPWAPSGNLGIWRSVFEAVGGFDASMPSSEDTALSWELLDRGYRLRYAPRAVVHCRHRATTEELARQYQGYGRSFTMVCGRFQGRGPEITPEQILAAARRDVARFVPAAAPTATQMANLVRVSAFIKGCEEGLDDMAEVGPRPAP